MTETKKPLPGVPDRGAAAEDNERTLDPMKNQAVTLQVDNTMQSGRVQGLFERILPKGAENAVSTPGLLKVLGLSDQRVIRKLISEERAAGAVILSNGNGYFLPDEGEKGRQEAAAFIATVKAKGKNTLRAARSAEDYLQTLPGQMEMEGEEGGKA